jgi:nucleotide-binding universal stress UspA family protein
VKARSIQPGSVEIPVFQPGIFIAVVLKQGKRKQWMGKKMKLLPLRSILCPTDFSDWSFGALRHAVELAIRFDTELCLLYVIPELAKPIAVSSAGATARYETELDDLEETLHVCAQQKLHEVIEKQVPQKVRARSLIGHGDAAREIARIAESEAVGLIVIATQG